MRLLAIGLTVTMLALAQISLKKGLTELGGVQYQFPNILPELWRVFTNGFVITAVTLVAGASLLWLRILSRSEVSYAYPMVSLAYVVVAGLSWLLLRESVTPLRLFGILLICAGVFIVGRT